MSWRNLRIAAKLATAFGAVMLLMSALTLFMFMKLAQLNRHTDELSKSWLARVQRVGELRGLLDRLRSAELQHAMVVSNDDKARAESQIRSLRSELAKVARDIELDLIAPEERATFQALTGRIAAYGKAADHVLELSNAVETRFTEARKYSGTEAAAEFARVEEPVTRLVALSMEGAQQASRRASEKYRAAVRMSLLGFVLATALLLGCAWAISRSVAQPAKRLVSVVRQIASGDLTVNLSRSRSDEMGQIETELSAMRDALSRIVLDVKRATDNVATASMQIAIGNQDLSIRTEQASSSLQVTASSVEELTATVRQAAEVAAQANSLAAQASGVASRGGIAVCRVVETMGDIRSDSRRIADIVSVIDAIAFQTKILALNAAVEAARAGDKGRGFAVVADEVQALAQRSASAAKEIGELIVTSVQKVEAGAAFVRDAGETMAEIVANVGKVGLMIDEISGTASQQSAGMADVSESVCRLDRMTQQNAALVEEAAAAADSLKEQARELAFAVGVFRVSEESATV